jgi:hypothetical protein
MSESVSCAGTCTLVLKVTDAGAEALTPEKVADYTHIFWLAFLALAAVWSVKRLISLFRTGYES